ncbi:MAG TPA: hypothetical protein VF998_01795 [Candidatus Limnocylindria bacterium]
MGVAIGAGATALGALVAAALVALSTRSVRRGKQRELAIARGLRRGTFVGALAGLVAVLRIVDALTPLTAAFLVLPFVAAELALSARRT